MIVYWWIDKWNVTTYYRLKWYCNKPYQYIYIHLFLSNFWLLPLQQFHLGDVVYCLVGTVDLFDRCMLAYDDKSTSCFYPYSMTTMLGFAKTFHDCWVDRSSSNLQGTMIRHTFPFVAYLIKHSNRTWVRTWATKSLKALLNKKGK